MHVFPISQALVVSFGWRYLQNVEKHKTWTHAILTVDSQKAKEQVIKILCSKNIAGVFLGCCEVGQSASKATRPRGPPPRPRPDDTGRQRHSDGSQAAPQPQVTPVCPCQRGPPCCRPLACFLPHDRYLTAAKLYDQT